MLEIGNKLKEERLRQGFSLEEMSQKTHFSVTQLEAIENGNLDYFKDDISYVKFFIQHYCKALNLNYGEFRDEFDQSMITYTNMLSAKEVEELRRSNEQIQKKLKEKSVSKSKNKKKRLKKIDFSLFSMLVIACVMILALGFVLGNYIFPNLKNPQGNNDVPRVSDTTLPSTTADPEEEPNLPEDASCEVIFSMVNAKEYEIRNVNDCKKINVKVEFNQRTWIEAKINGTLDENIKSKVYGKGDSVSTTLENIDDELKLNIGYFRGNKFYINDVEVNLESSIANSTGGNVIYFRVKGA